MNPSRFVLTVAAALTLADIAHAGFRFDFYGEFQSTVVDPGTFSIRTLGTEGGGSFSLANPAGSGALSEEGTGLFSLTSGATPAIPTEDLFRDRGLAASDPGAANGGAYPSATAISTVFAYPVVQSTDAQVDVPPSAEPATDPVPVLIGSTILGIALIGIALSGIAALRR